jgi:hypothetical protein
VYNRFACGEEVFVDPSEAVEFIMRACEALGVSTDALTGPHKDRKTMRLRRLVATVGIERWNQQAGTIGRVLGKHPDVVGRWERSGAERRASDAQFAKEIDALDSFLAGSTDP